MRITQSMMSRMGTEQLMAQRTRLARTQQQASTGLRINRPSDDPVDYTTAAALKDSLGQTGRFLRSIDMSRTRLHPTEDAISDAADVVSRASVLALQARNDPTADGARDALRAQAEQLFDELLSLSNTRAPGGGYVFSGVASDVESFTQTGTFTSGGPPPGVTFSGDASAIEVEIDAGVTIEVTRDGQQVFQGGVDIFAALGELWAGIDGDDPNAIDNAIGDLNLAREHLLREQGRVGAAEAKANALEDRLQSQEVELETQISLLEDADVLQVYSELVAQESALQATLAVTGRLLTPTLLDFI